MPAQFYRTETFRARTGVGYLLKAAHSAIADHLASAVAPYELTFVQAVTLLHLRDGEAVNAAMLCERLRYDSGALTRVIDQLEERGWVERQRSAVDRRAVELSLTPAGRARIDAVVPAVVERLNLLLRDFTRQEVADLTRLLLKLIASAELPQPADAGARS